ncbi:hypothetical protein PHYBOEH_000372 [Phytophthora boehmeriae]|uniref:RxLR effector protein n=1 Tax=Phytophthora boehmeriae TaxID=109152 RepID=A0A8T1WW72_9STRA|nr:hypothetical protein PHYBOEH_000372 [Phytophthora boehmeriae]
MRVYHVFLLLVVTLTACCITTMAAANPHQLESVDSISTKTNSNRLLRGQGATNDDDDKIAMADEERSITGIRKTLGLYNAKLNTKTFNAMTKDEALKAKVFAKWDKYDVPYAKIQDKMLLQFYPHLKKLMDEYVMHRLALKGLGQFDDVAKKADGVPKNKVGSVPKEKKKVGFNEGANIHYDPVDNVAKVADDVAAAV